MTLASLSVRRRDPNPCLTGAVHQWRQGHLINWAPKIAPIFCRRQPPPVSRSSLTTDTGAATHAPTVDPAITTHTRTT